MYTEEMLKSAVKDSYTIKDTLIKLGISPRGGNYKTIKRKIKLFDINISHFDSEGVRLNKLKKVTDSKIIPLKDILKPNSTYNRTSLKARLYKEGLKSRFCEMCGQDENWNGSKMSLILDHINGVPDDNTLDNLRIVCPNCNATLDTHCGKNNKKIKVTVYCTCGKIKNKKSKKCKDCSKGTNRKVVRPDIEIVKKDIDELGYSRTGRKYGVSDNAIRKWLK